MVAQTELPERESVRNYIVYVICGCHSETVNQLCKKAFVLFLSHQSPSSGHAQRIAGCGKREA